MLNADIQSVAQDIANQLSIPDITWLLALIQNESSWNPGAYNASSGATGLIQFIPRTMKGLGLLPVSVSSQIPASGIVPDAVKAASRDAFLSAYPDEESQLKGPVLKYLQQYAPFPTEQSLYMSVFYPAYRDKDLNTLLPASVSAANPGIDTVGDYVALVQAKTASFIATGTGKAVSVGLLAVAAAGIYLYWNSKA